jgi:hypothetical protein
MHKAHEIQCYHAHRISGIGAVFVLNSEELSFYTTLYPVCYPPLSFHVGRSFCGCLQLGGQTLRVLNCQLSLSRTEYCSH